MKTQKISITHKGVVIQLEKQPFAYGRNLLRALDAILETGKKEGACAFYCENDLLSNCDMEVIKFKIK